MAFTVSTRCCVAGGGPAGMMLGFLLARAGVDVVVLEKHADFLRDFRGDTIHPSTLELMRELGLLASFLKLPHQQVAALNARFGDVDLKLADFSELPTHCRFIALMPQWDFLNFLAERAQPYPAFHLRMRTEVTGLIEQHSRVVGVTATTPEGPLEVRADLVIGADGRHSTVRRSAALEVRDLDAPLDVRSRRIRSPHRGACGITGSLRRQELGADRTHGALSAAVAAGNVGAGGVCRRPGGHGTGAAVAGGSAIRPRLSRVLT
jgi:2-polyprenyl-6-methoxyphenol hydroxylase-like FAD-dependent oxidoreductase